MNGKEIRLEHVLTRKSKASLNPELVPLDELKRCARFWFGTADSNKMRKADCVHAMQCVLKDRKRVEEGVRKPSEPERQVLAICKRYGGSISGPLLMCEVVRRGLRADNVDPRHYARESSTQDPVLRLADKLLLVTAAGSTFGTNHCYYGYRYTYPDLVLQPFAADLIQPAEPLRWRSSASASAPSAVQRRSTAQVAVEIWGVSQWLAQSGTWATNRGGTLAKGAQNRLKKSVPLGEQDPLSPPQVESLYYEMLRGLGAITADDGGTQIDLRAVERTLRESAVLQSWKWVQAWLGALLWHDGCGVVPERRPRDLSASSYQHELFHARELLVWALCGVAHGTNDWLDLETFLCDLWSAMRNERVHFHCEAFAWRPEFVSAKAKEGIREQEARMRAYWLDCEGAWAANAILGTLYYLGLIERGEQGSGAKHRYCFRFTEVGKAVFGAPELPLPVLAYDLLFLTVQPNHEVIAYLDRADPRMVWPLAQLARRTSSTAGAVQTFAITRQSIYEALETGLHVEQIQRFLTEHSKTSLPANVAHSLQEWGRRRESLILRTDVSLGLARSRADDAFRDFVHARPLGDTFVLLPASAGRGQKQRCIVHRDDLANRVWRVAEDGTVTLTSETDAVTQARLRQFAERAGQDWRITATTVGQARERGIPPEQRFGWLDKHRSGELPPIVLTALRNWCSPGAAFLGTLVMLKVAQPQAVAAILSSQRLQRFLLEHVPPDWFIVRAEHRAELEKTLAELGFLTSSAYDGAAASKSRHKSAHDPDRIGGGRRSKSAQPPVVVLQID